MKTIFFLMMLIIFSVVIVKAQSIEESALEKMADDEDDAEVMDALEYLKKHPMDLNRIAESDLKIFRIVTHLQIEHFMMYRRRVGAFIDVHELQAIPLWDPGLIRQLLPYVCIGRDEFSSSLLKRLKHGEHSFLFRESRIMEKAAGYKIDNGYQSNREKMLFKYKYRYRDLLQYGLTMEKDPGEKMRPDFFSFHLFIRKNGWIRALALGDFSVNAGQGLVQYQSMSTGKTSDVIFIKQQTETLRPYSSSSEYNFNRGVGITIGKNKWEGTAFFSFTKLTATLSYDSLSSAGRISSLVLSGLHRTETELLRKNNTSLISVGGNLRYKTRTFATGINLVMHRFSLPLSKGNAPYHYFDAAGSSQKNVSADISYTYRNAHLFGEVAVCENGSFATIAGMMASVHQKADVSILYRKISPGYHAFNAKAFLESGEVTNETGFYTGLSVRPTAGLTIQAYTDVYQYLFFKYRISGPSLGSDLFLQAAYQPNKKISIYMRYQQEYKEQDSNAEQSGIEGVSGTTTRKWRLHYIYVSSSSLRLQARAEVKWFRKGEIVEDGMTLYFDATKKVSTKFSLTVRLLVFETGGFESRIYAYEPDVPYAASVPFFYGKGQKYLVVGKFDLLPDLEIAVKWGQTVYDERSTVGTGLDMIIGNVRSDLRVQLLYSISSN